ncbi:hypothetical protein CD351_09990 [Erythrobacter sp. KY5]|nr:hypothetical protein CD351_09990 [Erythrobacter sp. KY5]
MRDKLDEKLVAVVFGHDLVSEAALRIDQEAVPAPVLCDVIDWRTPLLQFIPDELGQSIAMHCFGIDEILILRDTRIARTREFDQSRHLKNAYDRDRSYLRKDYD